MEVWGHGEQDEGREREVVSAIGATSLVKGNQPGSGSSR
jgi:hypothetical protein